MSSTLSRFLAMLLLLLAAAAAGAQNSVTVTLLSDVHFDPFHDPAHLPALRAAPVERWPQILGAAPSPARREELDALEQVCQMRALDTDWDLLSKTLAAAHDANPRPTFVAVPGDLLTHAFRCRFQHLVPGATDADVDAFAAKTIAFTLGQMRSAFPGAPVYAALGNNDTGCGDYQANPDDAFLRAALRPVSAAAGIRSTEVTPEGDYSVALPAPIQRGRLLVLQDIFMARNYRNCAGTADPAPAQQQIQWLQKQLAAASAAGEQVWVMAHIPAGVDVFASFRSFVLRPGQLCSAEPKPFLAGTQLADTLLHAAGVVRLALFGHTHMDEFRALRNPGTGAVIPVKIVPSVTSFAGNHPAFIVATVNARTAVLRDWTTWVSPAPEGSAAPWTAAYHYRSTWQMPDFSAASAGKLAEALEADPEGKSAASRAVRTSLYPGDIGLYALGMAQIWPAYACSIGSTTPAAVQGCICKATGSPVPATATP